MLRLVEVTIGIEAIDSPVNSPCPGVLVSDNGVYGR